MQKDRPGGFGTGPKWPIAISGVGLANLALRVPSQFSELVSVSRGGVADKSRQSPSMDRF